MNEVISKLRTRGGAVVVERMRRHLPAVASELMQYSQFWPHEGAQDAYSRPISIGPSVHDDRYRFPIPPKELWASYCTSAESFAASGEQDVQKMSTLLADSGFRLPEAQRIVELGCAGGRMLRWIPEVAPDAELWGTDIWSTAIMWCQENLSPPAHFVTNTMSPHLSFADQSVDLVYCGSVFTHVDDLAEAWFLELHRIIRPGGRLYFSINDRHSAEIITSGGRPEYWERTGGRENWDAFATQLREREEFRRFMSGDAYMFTMGRSMIAHVMWDPEVLAERLSYGWTAQPVIHEAYGHQSVMILERR